MNRPRKRTRTDTWNGSGYGYISEPDSVWVRVDKSGRSNESERMWRSGEGRRRWPESGESSFDKRSISPIRDRFRYRRSGVATEAVGRSGDPRSIDPTRKKRRRIPEI